MDDFSRYKSDYSYRQNSKYKVNQFWSQRHNVLPEGMPTKMMNHKKQLKFYIDLLNEEYRPNRNKEKFYNLRGFNFQRSSKIMDDVSPHAKKMLLKIGKRVKKIKQSISDITKMNGLYLEDKARMTLNTPNRTNSIFNLKRSPSLIEKGNKTFNSNFNFLSNQGENIKERFPRNFMYVNDNYRKQLNLAFLKYNPKSHLENLKVIINAEPSIRNDIKRINQEVEEDIKWQCDPLHFSKKYLVVIAQHQRSKSVEQMKRKNNNEKSKALPPKINTNSPTPNNESSMSNKKVNRYMYKNIKLFEKFTKKEIARIKAQREMSRDEMRQMIDATKEINNLIQKDNINDKIDMFKTDYMKLMYCPRSESSSSVHENLLDKDYFIDEKKSIVEKIGNVYSFRVSRNANEKNKIYKGKISSENEKFMKKISDGKRNTMKEFYKYLSLNKVKLPEDKILDEDTIS